MKINEYIPAGFKTMYGFNRHSEKMVKIKSLAGGVFGGVMITLGFIVTGIVGG